MIINTPVINNIPGWFRNKGIEDDVVISSRVRLSRNLTGFLFPNKMELKDEEQVEALVTEAFKVIDKSLNVISLSEISSVERRMLAERSLISQDFTLDKHKFFILSMDQKLSCMINEHDHLRMSVFESGLGLEQAYTIIDLLESKLEKILDFAVSLEFGYLNDNIRNSGTGMKISVMVHLPALVRLSLFDRAIKSSLEKEFTVKGFLGNDDGSLGDIYQISNGLAIGNDENELIEQLTKTSLKLVAFERQAREELVEKRKIELEDRTYRSIGLISNCRLLTSSEAIKALADLRLGIALGFSDLDLGIVNSLLIMSQKAHIQFTMNDKKIDTRLLDAKRTEIIRGSLNISF
jgi:protein arginine kinase